MISSPRSFHVWVPDGEPQVRLNAMYEGDPKRQNYVCTGCKSTKSELIWTNKKGEQQKRLNRYQAISPTCAQKQGFNNRKYYRDKDIITRQQTNNLINKIPEYKTRVLTKILYLYAPRIQETLLLKKSDLIIRGNELILNRYILKVPLEPDGSHPKKLTHIPLADSFCEEIIEVFKNTPRPNDFVFPREKMVFGIPEPIDYHNHLSRDYSIKLVKEATGNSCHFFRHLRISHWATMCKTIFDLKKKTHHYSIKSLEKYIHLLPDSFDIEVG